MFDRRGFLGFISALVPAWLCRKSLSQEPQYKFEPGQTVKVTIGLPSTQQIWDVGHSGGCLMGAVGCILDQSVLGLPPRTCVLWGFRWERCSEQADDLIEDASASRNWCGWEDQYKIIGEVQIFRYGRAHEDLCWASLARVEGLKLTPLV